MITVVEGKGLTIEQLRRQIAAAEAKADKTPTEQAALELMRTCLALRDGQ